MGLYDFLEEEYVDIQIYGFLKWVKPELSEILCLQEIFQLNS